MKLIGFRYAASDRGIRNIGIGLNAGLAADNMRTVNPLEFASPVMAIAGGSNIGGLQVCLGYALGSTSSFDPWDEGYVLTHEVAWISQIVFVDESEYPLATLNPGQDYLEGLMSIVLKKLQ